MDIINNIVAWHAQHVEYIDLVKDFIFTIGVFASFYGYYKFLKFLTQRRTMFKKHEMENDSIMYGKLAEKLRGYVKEYGVTPTNLREIKIRLLYMKNYPYNLDNDGFKFRLYYYLYTEHSQPSGYVSGKGLYVLHHLKFFSESVYLNSKNGKWFIDKEGQSFNRYKELVHSKLVKHIPFTNIYGFDFNSDWAEGEPVFYTKYKYYQWKLFANALEAISQENGEYPSSRVTLLGSKRVRKCRTELKKIKVKIKSYYRGRKISRQS